MRRLMLFDHLGNTLGELAEADVFAAILREEINGEHSLEITTTRVLEKGTRLLYEDGRGKWREFVVAGVDAEHASGNRAIGTYYCVWSIQNDLQGVTVSVMPGVQSAVNAATALQALLSTTERWVRGTVTNTATGGASMYDRSAWEALTVLVEVWGGEVDATITTTDTDGVTGRAVDLYTAQGEQTAKRRFDFAHDLQSVKRILADAPLFCRISPRGAGEETDAGGYGRKITIASVNSGLDYLEYSPMVDVAKLSVSGGYEYPTLIVENSECKTPADLKAWAQSVLAEYCTPKVTYEVDVIQAGIEGVDVSGVSLGDAVQVVDRKFSDAGIRIEGRVRSITTDLLNERDISVVIGDAEQSIAAQFAIVDKSIAAMNNDLTVMSTAEYIDNLLERINTEINATGGYTYITEGQGIRTYDTAVSDPLVGAEASAVVEIKGGTIRIANTKTAQGEWEWKTVFTSGHIAANLVTAAQITTGYIGSAGDTFIDLDNHTVQLGQTSGKHLTLNTSVMEYFDGSTSVIRLSQDSFNDPWIRIGSAALAYLLLTTGGLDLYQNGTSIASLGTQNNQLSIRLGKPYSSGESRVTINPTGMEIAKGSARTAYFGLDANDVPICQLGASSSSMLYLSGAGSIDMKSGVNSIAHFGYDLANDASGGTTNAPYYTLGTRLSQSGIGMYSVAAGYNAVASAAYSVAFGDVTKATGIASMAAGWITTASGKYSHAEGQYCVASGEGAFALGMNCTASGANSFAAGWSSTASAQSAFAMGINCTAAKQSSFAFGNGTYANGVDQTVIGQDNVHKGDSYSFIVGKGTSETKSDSLELSLNGNLWIAGTLTQNSDRRLKEHISYLDEDACEFVRKLKPALFVKDGERHLGFYAQDVDEADTWDTVTVTESHTTEEFDFDPLTLEYSALIAPLVAYCQRLEQRIAQLEKEVGANV